MKDTDLYPPWAFTGPERAPVERYTPTPWHGHIANLAYNPEATREKLLLHQLSSPYFENIEENIEENFALSALINFLDSCVEPIQGGQVLSFDNASMVDRIPSCSKTEKRFANTFSRMTSVTDLVNPPVKTMRRGWITYVDESLEPIAIKKFDGIKSALSLAALVIDGRSYPGGSYLRIKSPHLDLPRHSRGVVTPFGASEAVRFLRLSASGHKPVERASVFIGLDFTSPSALLSLNEITQLARENMRVSEHIGF